MFGFGYFTYTLGISKTHITNTYNEIYKMANTANTVSNTNYTNSHITRAITTLWTLPTIPAILLYTPPYQATKTIKKHLPSLMNDTRV